MPFVMERFGVLGEQKLFLFLMRTFNISQKEAQSWVDRGRVFVEGEVVKQKNRVVHGMLDIVRFIPHPQGLNPIFSTPDFALFDKPSGVLTHPKNIHTPYSMIDEIRHHFGKEANPTHRIDKETSGLLLVSRHKEAEIAIKTLFERRKVHKNYLAFVFGHLEHAVRIDKPILKNSAFDEIKLKVTIDARGKSAITDITPLRYYPQQDITLVQASPKTGRQHQIRVHLASIGHAIVGDPIYSVDTEIAKEYLDDRLSLEERRAHTGASRLLLHAQSVEFTYGTRYTLVSKERFEESFDNTLAKIQEKTP